MFPWFLKHIDSFYPYLYYNPSEVVTLITEEQRSPETLNNLPKVANFSVEKPGCKSSSMAREPIFFPAVSLCSQDLSIFTFLYEETLILFPWQHIVIPR